MRSMLLAAVLAAALAATGCGASAQDDTAGDGSGGPSMGVPATPLTVEEALATDTAEPLLVRGAIVAEGGTVRLCGALAESHPPQCGRPWLVVEGLALDTLEGTQTASGVTWVEDARVLGTRDGGTLRVSDTVR